MRDYGRAVDDLSESIGTRPPGGSAGIPHEVYADLAVEGGILDQLVAGSGSLDDRSLRRKITHWRYGVLN